MICNLRNTLICSIAALLMLNLMGCTGSPALSTRTPGTPAREPSVQITPGAVGNEITPAAPVTPVTENSDPISNGLEVVYTKGGNLWISSNGKPNQLTDSGFDSHPKFSKDNQLIAFQRGDELWVMEPGGGQQRKVFGADGQSLYQFEFIGNSHAIIFSTASSGQPRFDLNRVDADQGQVQNLLAEGEAGKFIPSPDWKSLVLVQPAKILTYSLENGKSTQTYQMQPTKDPTGDHLVPVSWMLEGYNTVIPAMNGKPALFIFIPAAGGKMAQLADFTPVSTSISDVYLSADASKILYLKQQLDNLEMHVVDASTADRTYLRKPDGKIGLLGWAPDSINMLFWVDEPRYVYISDGIKVTRLSEHIKAGVTSILWVDARRCLVLSGSSLLLVLPGQTDQQIDSGVDAYFDALLVQ